MPRISSPSTTAGLSRDLSSTGTKRRSASIGVSALSPRNNGCSRGCPENLYGLSLHRSASSGTTYAPWRATLHVCPAPAWNDLLSDIGCYMEVLFALSSRRDKEVWQYIVGIAAHLEPENRPTS